MGSQIERKYFKFSVKSVDDAGRFTGYASVFNMVDSYGDVVQRGAFSKTLQEQKTFPLLWSHDVANPIGICWGQEDSRGLLIEGELNLEVQRAREIHALMKQGAVRGLSIGYTTIKDEQNQDDKTRLLKEIKLWEVSLVVFPANQAAMVLDVRSMGEFQEETIELKPYPNEHAARLQDPELFDRFRRTKDGNLFNRIKVPETISIIWGRFKDSEDWAAQSIRFPAKDWTAEEAKKWLRENEVNYQSFEEAKKMKGKEEEEKAEWTVAYINSLPDEAFAVIEPAYKRGDTEDKNARHLPHHNKGVTDPNDDESVDLPHLRNALARMNQIKPVTDSISAEELRAKAAKHLLGHAKRLEIGDYAKEDLEALEALIEETEKLVRLIQTL